MTDSTAHEIARVARRAEGAAASTAASLASTGHITGEARSADGTITVVVSPGGMLQDVQLTAAALRRGAAEVSREVVALAGRATRQADGRLRRALSGVLDPAATRALRTLGVGTEPERGPDFDDDSVLRRVL